MKKVFAIALALIMVLGCFAGCGNKEASDLAAVKKAGKIVVGITDYEPMDYMDENGEYTAVKITYRDGEIHEEDNDNISQTDVRDELTGQQQLFADTTESNDE